MSDGRLEKLKLIGVVPLWNRANGRHVLHYQDVDWHNGILSMACAHDKDNYMPVTSEQWQVHHNNWSWEIDGLLQHFMDNELW